MRTKGFLVKYSQVAKEIRTSHFKVDRFWYTWIGLFNSKCFDYPTFCTLVENENRILSDFIASLFTLMATQCKCCKCAESMMMDFQISKEHNLYVKQRQNQAAIILEPLMTVHLFYPRKNNISLPSDEEEKQNPKICTNLYTQAIWNIIRILHMYV